MGPGTWGQHYVDEGTNQRHLNYLCYYNAIGAHTLERPGDIKVTLGYKMGLH